MTVGISNLDISYGHGLYLFGGFSRADYSSYVNEYDNEVYGPKPHLILLGAQTHTGKDGSIMLGELLLILTAMHNRAYQPSRVIKGEAGILEADVWDENDLLFKDECKFPVSYSFRLGVILRLTCSDAYGFDRCSPEGANILCLHERRGAGDSAIEVIRLGNEEQR